MSVAFKTNKEATNDKRRSEMASRLSTYESIKNNKSRLETIREEIIKIRALGLTNNDKQIMNFYTSPLFKSKLGTVLKCVELYIDNLDRLGYPSARILEILNDGCSIRACLNDSKKLKERMELFDKCGVLAEVMEKYPSLLAATFDNEDLRIFIEINENIVEPSKLAYAIRENRGYVPKRKMN